MERAKHLFHSSEDQAVLRRYWPGEADEQRLLIPFSSEQPRFSSGRPASPRIISPRVTSPQDYSHSAVSPRYSLSSLRSPLQGLAASLRVTSLRAASLRVTTPQAASSKSNRHCKEVNYVHRPEPTLQVLHDVSATRIQAALGRGYMQISSNIILKDPNVGKPGTPVRSFKERMTRMVRAP